MPEIKIDTTFLEIGQQLFSLWKEKTLGSWGTILITHSLNADEEPTFDDIINGIGINGASFCMLMAIMERLERLEKKINA